MAPTQVEELATFVSGATFDRLSDAAREALKLRVLDSLGTALGALDARPVALVRELVDDFGGAPYCTLIGGEHVLDPHGMLGDKQRIGA